MRPLAPLRALPALLLFAAAFAALFAPSAAAQPCMQDVGEVLVEVGPKSISFLLAGELIAGDDARQERDQMDEDLDGEVSDEEVTAYERDLARQYSNLLVLFDRPRGITLDDEAPKGWWIPQVVYYNATGAADDRTMERDTLLELNYTGRGSQTPGALPGDHTARFAEDLEAFCPVQFDVAYLGAAAGWFILTDSVEPARKLDWFRGEGFTVPFSEVPDVVSEDSPLNFTVRQQEREPGAKKKGPGLELPLVALGLLGAAAFTARRRGR